MARTSTEEKTIKLKIDGKGTATTLKELQADGRKLKAVLSNINPNEKGKIDEYKKKLAQVESATKKVKEQTGLIKPRIDKAINATDKWGKATSKIGGIFQNILKASGILMLVDQVISLVQGLAVLGKEAIDTRRELELLTGATGKELDELTAKTLTLSKALGEDTTKVTQALNAQMQAFGKTGVEAMEAYQKAALLAVDANEELTDVITEYSPLVAEAGVKQEEFFEVLINAERSGSFSLDKVADSFKEFALRVNEQTKATSDALAVLGTDFRDNLFDQLNKGTITAKGAMESIVTQMEKTGVQGKELQTIIADVFGAQGEDLGKKFVFSLNDSKQSLDDLIGSADSYTKAQIKMQKGQEAFFKVLTKVSDAVASFFYEVIAQSDPIVAVFTTLGKEIYQLYTAFSTLINSLGIFKSEGSVVKTLVEGIAFALTLLYTPFKITIQLLTTLTNQFIKLYNTSETLRGFLGGFGAAIVSIFTDLKKVATNTLGGIGDLLIGIVSFDKSKIEAGFSQLKAGLKTQYLNLGENAAKAFTEGYNSGKDNQIKAIEESTTEAVKKVAKVVAQNKSKVTVFPSAEDLKKQQDAAKKAAEEQKKLAEQVAKDNQQLDNEIAQRKAELIQNETQYQIARSQADAARRKKEIEETLADEQRKAEAIRLIDEQLALDLELIKTASLERQREIENQNELAKAETQVLQAEQGGDLESIMEAKLAQLETERQIELQNKELTEAQKLLIQEDYNNRSLELEKQYQTTKKMAVMEGVGALGDAFQMGAEFLGQDEKAKKKHLEKIKKFEIANVGLKLFSEIQAIWQRASENPLNSIIPGFGAILAGVQTALAIGRGAKAVQNIEKQKMAMGGELVGPSHANGGINGWGGFGNIEAEGGEFMVNKPAYANNTEIVKAINTHGKTARFGLVRMATGGELPASNVSTTPSSATINSIGQNAQDNAMMQQLTEQNMLLVAETRALRQDINTFEREKEVVLNTITVEDKLTENAKVRSY